MNAKRQRQVNRIITILFVASACSLIAVQPAISGEGQPLCAISVADTSDAQDVAVDWSSFDPASQERFGAAHSH